MNYKKILKFIDKCLGLLKLKPVVKNVKCKEFLFCDRGEAIYLQITTEPDYVLKGKLYWDIASPAERYSISHCGWCKSENPCDNHQESASWPINSDILWKARRANEIGLKVEVPEPIYPKIEKGFDSLEQFKEETKNLFPIFYENVGWTFPPLKENLKWDTEKINYPKITGYSPDGKIEYKRSFYKVSEGGIHMLELLEHLERLPKETKDSKRSEYLELLSKFKELKKAYRKVNKPLYAKRKRRHTTEERQKLKKERRELALEFSIKIP